MIITKGTAIKGVYVDAGLGLPKRFYVTLLSLLAMTMVICLMSGNKEDQLIILCLSLLFAFSAIHGALQIRMGKIEFYKNALNAIWNIYTACAFIYGLYIMINYSAAGIKNPEDIVSMAMSETFIILPVIIFLGVICIVRAGYSVAETFKSQIILSRKKRAEYQQSTIAE